MVLLLALVQLMEQEESSVLGMCTEAVGYNVGGKGMEKEGTDAASTLAFPNGRKECTEDTEMHGYRLEGVRVPQHCSNLSHTEALDFLHWC